MIHVIVNPAGAGGAAARAWRKVRVLLEEEKVSYRVFFSRPELDVDVLVEKVCRRWEKETAKSETDHLILIVIGGDGTMNLAVNGITDFDRVHVGFIPCGSGNDLARSLGITKNVKNELTAILTNARLTVPGKQSPGAGEDSRDPLPAGGGSKHSDAPRHLDIGEVQYFRCIRHDETLPAASAETAEELQADRPAEKRAADPAAQHPVYTRLFNISSGIGFDASICYEVSVSRVKPLLNRVGLGKLAYLAAAIRTVFGVKHTEAEITIDGQPLHCGELLLAACMNEPYEGGGFRFGPEADASDGILDLCVADGVSSGAFFRIFPTAYRGHHVRFKGVDLYRGRVMDIKTRRPMWVHTDGEIEFLSDHVCFHIKDEKLHLLN